MEDIIYAIGDVHGRADLLARLHDTIRVHHAAHHPARSASLVHLGDYIDRGSDSRGAIDRAMAGLPEFGNTCLMGNHEAMMLDCLGGGDKSDWALWLRNGGEATMRSFDVAPGHGDADPARLAAALGPERSAWLRGLRLSHLSGRYLFVHAGIRPGVPLGRQDGHDLLWIRYEFLDSDADHGVVVVHGHTPVDAPELRPNRIGIDTGAVFSGVLTAAVLNPDGVETFLHATD